MTDTPIKPTCETCKWWGDRFTRMVRNCSGARCHLPHHGTGDSIQLTVNDRATADDGGNIHTGPSYGCIHHEPKEPA